MTTMSKNRQISYKSQVCFMKMQVSRRNGYRLLISPPKQVHFYTYLVIESYIHKKPMHVCPEKRRSNEMCEPWGKLIRKGQVLMKS